MENLITNPEAEQIRIGRNPLNCLIANIATQAAVVNAFEKSFDFLPLTLRLEMDAAIGQVTHRATHLIAFGYLLHGEAKPHALHPTFVKDFRPLHRARRYRKTSQRKDQTKQVPSNDRA